MKSVIILFLWLALALSSNGTPCGNYEGTLEDEAELDEVGQELDMLFDNIDDIDEDEDGEEDHDEDTTDGDDLEIDVTNGDDETEGEDGATDSEEAEAEVVPGAGPDVRRGEGRGHRRGPGHHRGSAGPGGRGRGRAGRRGGPGRRRPNRRGRRDGHPACPLMEGSVTDMNAFVDDCLKEHRRVKVMIRKSRRNRRKACTHECCEVAQGKKCCPVIKEGSCALALKDSVTLKLKVMRRQGGRGGRRGQGGRGRGQGGRGQGGRGWSDEDQSGGGNSTCPYPQPFLRQMISCGTLKSRLLFVKGVPSAVNPNLLCRTDVDCGEEEVCCSSAEDKCNRSCSKIES